MLRAYHKVHGEWLGANQDIGLRKVVPKVKSYFHHHLLKRNLLPSLLEGLSGLEKACRKRYRSAKEEKGARRDIVRMCRWGWSKLVEEQGDKN